LVLAVPEHQASQILETLTKNGEKAVVLGEIITGDQKICL
jgi:phosphoribosylaminoimidazole (AIR) synthetase